MAGLTDDELGALVDSELRTAVGFSGGKLAEARRKAEYYYYAEAKEELAPPEIVGRSKVVVPVVRNTIESMLPQLMVKFTGGDTVVEFEPTQQEDEDKAKQATDYCNYLFFKKNNGHQVTYSWFKDALKFKRGIIKVWWDERDEEKREEYKGLSQVELAQIMEDPEIEVTEQKSYPDEDDASQRQKAIEHFAQQLQEAQMAAQQGNAQALQASIQIKAKIDQIGQMPPAMLYDITCKRTKSGGKVCIENVPPEEFGISRKAKMDLQEAPAVFHRFRRTKSQLLSMGYSKSIIESLGNDSLGQNAERDERVSFDDEVIDDENNSGDESQREFWVVECYLRCDFDGDGIAELRKVTRCGGKNLDNEITDSIPFVSICPVPEPHKFFGLSVADLAMEGQRTETAILRSTLDNLYLEVNGRYWAVEGQVNLDDLLSSRPGGVVRTKNMNAVGRLDQGKGNIGESMSMMEYMKSFSEDSTGWSRISQGNDPSALNKPETATKANIVTNKADMRLDLIARNFAEGFVELFRLMLKLVCQNQKKAATIKLSGKWVPMDPREWRNQFDVTINVGLGVGSKDQQIQHLMVLQQTQGHGLAIGISTPENLYNSSVELAKNMGFKSGDKFFTRPDPNKPLPNPGAAEAQAKQQIEQSKIEAQGQMKAMEFSFKQQSEQAHMQQEAALEEMRARYQAMVDQNRQQSEAAQQQQKIEMEAQLSQLKEHYAAQDRERDMRFQEWKLQMELESKERIAQINAESKLDAAQVAAASTLSADQEAASDAAVDEDEPMPTDKGPHPHVVLAAAMQGMTQAMQSMNKPRSIVRGPDGKATGIE